MSSERSRKNKVFHGVALAVTNQFWIPSFYRYMSTQTVRKNFKVMLAMIVSAAVLSWSLTGIIGPLLLAAAILTTLPFVFLASGIDPIIAWLRGGTNRPWPLFRRVLTIHLWAIVSPLITMIVVVSVTAIFGGFEIADSGDEPTGNTPIYLAFAALVGLHLYMGLTNSNEMRKEQKVVSSLAFALFFFSVPAGHIIATIA